MSILVTFHLQAFRWLSQTELGIAMLVCKKWAQVGGARWAELPFHLDGSKLPSLSSIIRLFKALRWQILFSLHCSQRGSRLTRVQRLHVTLHGFVVNLATTQFIFDSFPHMRELVMKLPWDYYWNSLFTLSNLLRSRGVTSCISIQHVTMYSSPTPTLKADLYERGLQGNHSIFIYQSLHQDLPNILQLATNTRVTCVCVNKFTGYVEVEESLKKLEIFSVVREAGDNEEVVEEEVKAAIRLLDLLADRDRRGKLRQVNLFKALLLLCSDWVERLGGRQEVEQLASHTWYDAMEPFASIVNIDHGRLKIR